MHEFSTLIADTVAAKLTPDFIEKEVNTRVEKLIVGSIDSALRSYSETGKLIEKAVADALQVGRLDLPSYGHVVSQMVKAQIELRVADLVQGRLAEDIEELLKLAPKEVKLSQIAEDMRKPYVDDGAYGEVITVIVAHSEYGSTWLYLDPDKHYAERDKYRCKHRILISQDGTISGAWLGEGSSKTEQWICTLYGLDQLIRAYVACNTRIIIDEDAVCTSVGDY